MSIRENTNRLLDGLRQLAPELFAGRDPLKVLESLTDEQRLPTLREFADSLRDIAIDDSAVGRIEHFMKTESDAAVGREVLVLPNPTTGRVAPACADAAGQEPRGSRA